MRIAYISNSIIPSRSANSIHVMKMCQAFADNGYEVKLLAPNYPEIESAVEDVYKYYGVKENFEIIKLDWKNIKGGAYLYGLSTSKYIKNINPDIVYGRFLTGCYFSGLFNNYPIIYEAHKPIMDAGKIQDKLFRKTIKLRNFSHLVVISDSLKRHYLKKYDFTTDRIIVAHDGADIPNEDIKPAKLSLYDKEKVNVGYFGHLYPGKGMELISEIAKECTWANFHIFGGVEEDISYWQNKLSNLENIKFYGFIPHSEIMKFIKSCDILLAPYNNKVQGYGGKGSDLSKWMSPLKIFEYMSSGRAIVCSDLPVLREILEDSNNALLCDPNSISSWVKAIQLLAKDVNLRTKIGRNGYNDFKTEYTWSARVNKVLNY